MHALASLRERHEHLEGGRGERAAGKKEGGGKGGEALVEHRRSRVARGVV